MYLPLFWCIPALYTIKRIFVKHLFAISGKILKKILSYPQFKGAKREPHYDESPHAAMTKGAPQAGQRGRLFRGGHFCRRVFFVCRPFGNGGLSSSFERFGFFQLGVSLSAAARSADALVYDKLTPNCHSVKINRLRTKIDTSYGYSLYGNL